MEINELRISFRHQIDKNTEDQEKEDLYNLKSEKYSNIIKRNLVHEQIDYSVSNSTGVEKKYYRCKLVLTEFIGYIIIILVSVFLLFWSSVNTYIHVEYKDVNVQKQMLIDTGSKKGDDSVR